MVHYLQGSGRSKTQLRSQSPGGQRQLRPRSFSCFKYAIPAAFSLLSTYTLSANMIGLLSPAHYKQAWFRVTVGLAKSADHNIINDSRNGKSIEGALYDPIGDKTLV